MNRRHGIRGVETVECIRELDHILVIQTVYIQYCFQYLEEQKYIRVCFMAVLELPKACFSDICLKKKRTTQMQENPFWAVIQSTTTWKEVIKLYRIFS